MTSPFTTMSAGYATASRPRRKPLVPFRTDAQLEQILVDAAKGKATLTPEARMALGFYASAKAAHLASGKGERE